MSQSQIRNRKRKQSPETKSSETKATSNDFAAEQYALQNNLTGLITKTLLIDPVRIRGENITGAYERNAITKWLTIRGKSPLTNEEAKITDLIPAKDIREGIENMVKKYPNTEIVKEWLQNQPAWYKRVAAPVIRTMNRIGHNIIQNPTAATCAECCSRTGKIVSGAAVGATLGACAGCVCAGHFAESPVDLAAILPKVPLVTGAAGAVIGAAVGPSKCLELGKEACDRYEEMVNENPNLFFGGKKKTRKSKQKKKKKNS